MCWLLLVFTLFSQEGIVSEEIDSVFFQTRFSQAMQKYNSVERNDAAALFEELVTALEKKAPISDDERFILLESLKYLGVIYYPQKTEEYFGKLIQVDPGHVLNSRDLPPKIVTLFEEIRTKLVGSLRIRAMDAQTTTILDDATLTVDGQLVGPILGETTFSLLAGSRLIEVRRPNFEMVQATLSVPASQVASFDAVMRRIASEIVLVTIPAGVKVFINNEERGETRAPASPEYREVLAAEGLGLEDAGMIVLNGFGSGKHEIRFEKPCFQPSTHSLEIDENKRFLVRPARLAAAGAQLTVNTPGNTSGVVFLDSERIGYLPIEDHPICPGTYTLRVTFEDGQYVKNITVADGERRSFSAEPLPTIVWFGVERSAEGNPPPEINERLNGMKAWNLLPVDPNNSQQIPVNPFAILFEDRQITTNHETAMTLHLKGDLYMAARIVRKKVVIRFLEVAFWTPLSKSIWVVSFDFRELDKFAALLTNLDAMPPLSRSWLGIQTAKLRDLPGCQIIEVQPGGPLTGKVKVGDVIQTLNGSLVRDPGILRDLPSGTEVTLGVNDAQISVVPVASIAEVPFDPATYVPPALLAMFEKLSKYNPDPIVRAGAAFNQARYQFFLGDYKEAFDIFSTLTLDSGFGINQGTLNYYQGLCFRRLKLTTEALDAFKKVLAYPNATLFDAYGPRAAFWAETEFNTTGL